MGIEYTATVEIRHEQKYMHMATFYLGKCSGLAHWLQEKPLHIVHGSFPVNACDEATEHYNEVGPSYVLVTERVSIFHDFYINEKAESAPWSLVRAFLCYLMVCRGSGVSFRVILYAD